MDLPSRFGKLTGTGQFGPDQHGSQAPPPDRPSVRRLKLEHNQSASGTTSAQDQGIGGRDFPAATVKFIGGGIGEGTREQVRLNSLYDHVKSRLLPSPCIGLFGSMTFAGPGGYPRDALSLPIYGLTADACRWIPRIVGVRKRTKATSRTMQKSE